MDPVTVVGLTASIVQLIDATMKVMKYLNDMKDAPKDRAKLAREATSLLVLLTELRYMVEEAKSTDPWFPSIRSLGVKMGPLEQFKGEMEDLAKKLEPQSGIKKFGKTLRWTLDKKDIDNTLSKIERLKTFAGLALQKDHFALSRAIKNNITSVATEVSGLRVGQEGKQPHLFQYFSSLHGTEDIYPPAQKNRDIVAWISNLNFSTKQNDFFARRQEGTGEWLLTADVFKSWLDGTKRILWCPGLPGAGKTVLTSIVVDYLERSFRGENIAIAYIYCSYKELEDQTDINLIASLLQQLVQRQSFISDNISSLYRHHTKNQTRPTLSDWSKLLKSEVDRLSKVFVVIDALDECSESNGTRDRFLAEIRKLQPSIHLFITSRHTTSIEREFETASRLEISANDADVRRYLEHRIASEPQLVRHIKKDPTLRETMINSLVEKAKGMFLLAQLQMDSLVKKDNLKAIRKALPNMPSDLDGVYDEAMQRIRDQDYEKARRAEQVLSWISYALRPMTVTEIQHALAVEKEDVNFDEDAMPDEDVLVSVCAGLVTIDRESNIIRLVHYTTQEYFERIRTAQFPDAEAAIATICLVYISFDVFAEGHCRSDEEMEIRMHKYPLLEYAVQHWGHHADRSLEGEIQELVLKFLEHDLKLMCATQVMHAPRYSRRRLSQMFPRHVTALHTVASIGSAKLALFLLERGDIDVNPKDSNGGTPLWYAVERGHEEVVRLLLEHEGIDVNSKGGRSRTPLQRAAWGGLSEVARLLLEHEFIDANSMGNRSRTPLQHAAQLGHEAVVRLLLEHEGIDVNSKDEDGRTPLFDAAELGHEAVVRLLLEHEGVDFNSKDEDGRTPLFDAAELGHEAVVRLLLEHEGVDVNSKDKYSMTPLTYAAREGHEAVVRLLLAHEGIDVNSKDKRGRIPLMYAAWKGREAVVRLLLAHEGINVNSKEEDSMTPLAYAAREAHEAVVRLLLAHESIDVNSKDKYSITPLAYAAWVGREAVVRLLLAHEVIDVNSKDEDDRTPLFDAAELGYEAVVRLLLEHEGIDVNSKDKSGRIPLMYAAWREREAVVRLLLAHEGINVNSKDEDSMTPLAYAAREGHEAVVRLLLAHEGIDVNSKDIYGKTPLSRATIEGHKAVVQLLTPLTSNP